MRLIDADEFMENLIYCDGLGRRGLEAVLKTLKEQPTAYDVDKVVEQINGMEVVLLVDDISADNLKFTNKILRLVKDGAIERIRKSGVE